MNDGRCLLLHHTNHTILGNIRDTNKHVCNLQPCFFGLVSKQQVDLPLSKPFQLFGSHRVLFVGVEPGVVCHPIFASLLSYVAELQMEGAGI